ncbi:MAG: histidine kinase [Lacrimispora sp.]
MFKNPVYKLPFNIQIFLGCLLVAMIPLLFSGVFVVKIFEASLNRQSVTSTKKQLEDARDQIDQLFSSCESSCYELAWDSTTYRTMLDNSSIDVQKDLYLSLYQSVQKTYSSISFSLYDAGGFLRFTTESNNQISEYLPRDWGILKKASQSRNMAYYWTDPYLNKIPGLVLQAACSLENPEGARTGYLVLDFTHDNLSRILYSDYSDKDTFIILDHLGNPVYCTKKEYGPDEISQIITQARSGTDAGRFLYDSISSPKYGYTILLQKGSQISASGIKTMKTVSIAIALFCLWLCLMVSLALSRSISLPVSNLDRAMKKVRDGDLTIHLTTNRTDELGRLIESFNRMTRDLKSNLETAIRQQKDLNETSLKLYQTQLNPHFLYNTLDTIKWNAKINQNPQIPVLAENLAQILRSSISSSAFITLRQELETIKSYIEIQKIRFTERFVYEEEIPYQLEDCLVPKMILQPLVENAILHGLEDYSQGYICIYGTETEQDEKKVLLIAVTDNGRGMSQEIIDWINSPAPKNRTGHLGLYNIIQILKLYYGQQYGLHAELNPEGGTTVTLIFPLERG